MGRSEMFERGRDGASYAPGMWYLEDSEGRVSRPYPKRRQAAVALEDATSCFYKWLKDPGSRDHVYSVLPVTGEGHAFTARKVPERHSHSSVPKYRSALGR